MGVNKAFLAILAIVLLTSCASTRNIPECNHLRQRFKKIGINADKFRNYNNSYDELASDLVEKIGHSHDRGTAASLQRTASEACGGIDEPYRRNNQGPTIMTKASFETTWKYLYKKRRVMLKKKKKQRKFRSSVKNINLHSIFISKSVYVYPETKGLLRSDAKNQRRQFLYWKVIEKLNSIKKMVEKGESFQRLLESNTIEPINTDTAQKTKANLLSQLARLGMDTDNFNLFDRFFTRGASDAKHIFLATIDLAYLTYIPPDPKHFIEGSRLTKDDILRSLISDQVKRTVYLSKFLTFATEFKVKRIDKKKFVIEIKIDLPKFFKQHPARKISDFLEN